MENPVYHLRPNKAVDRNLFVEALVRLGKKIDIPTYRYIGFGSYEFDEFKLIYKTLGIEDLHSIEMDSAVFHRQQFNRPYSCIQLFNKTFGEYIDEDYDGTRHSIIWADFSEASKKHSQCQDIANICSKMQRGDILRITFNAQPSSISTGGKPVSEVPPEESKKLRFNTLKEDLNEFFPDGVSEEDLTQSRLPLLLLKTIKKAIYLDLDVELSPCPLCCYVYSDQMQMMTVTLLMCSANERESDVSSIKDSFKGWEDYIHVDEWDNPIIINLPPLTVHEQLEIGQYEKNEEGARKIEVKMGIKPDEVKRYLLYCRYYPNYQPVII